MLSSSSRRYRNCSWPAQPAQFFCASSRFAYSASCFSLDSLSLDGYLLFLGTCSFLALERVAVLPGIVSSVLPRLGQVLARLLVILELFVASSCTVALSRLRKDRSKRVRGARGNEARNVVALVRYLPFMTLRAVLELLSAEANCGIDPQRLRRQ